MIIYLLQNKVNLKGYIGQHIGNNPWDRWPYDIRKGNPNSHLLSSYTKYGPESFVRGILDYCSTEKELNDSEKFWIRTLKTYDSTFGYNKTMGGEGGAKTKETKKKIGEAVKNLWKSGCKYNLSDIIGQRFGRLLVISRSNSLKMSSGGNACWLCKCDCGKEKVICGTGLRNGNTQSCGCLQKERVRRAVTKHGWSQHRLANTFYGIIRHCSLSGVKICDEWKGNIEAFSKWSDDNNYTKGSVLVRYPYLKGDFNPENCKWVTKQEQGRLSRSMI